MSQTMPPLARVALLALFLSLSARAQFALVLPDDTPAPPVYDLGKLYTNESAIAHFRVRNLSATSQTLTTLRVAGVGFTLTASAVPLAIPAQAAIDFTVTFLAPDIGDYSAALQSDGIGILLTARVLPSLTYRVDSLPLSALNFGSVVRGAIARQPITLSNQTSVILIVPAISVLGNGFSLAAAPPSGQTLQPRQGGGFTVLFSPLSSGARLGTLVIGDRTYPLQGLGVDPPLPNPTLVINLQPAASAQQGALLIRFDAPSQTTGTGTATLDFRALAGLPGLADPAIAFATGGRTAIFFVAPGDTQVLLPFQTGTTAGTLAFTVELGQTSAHVNVTIDAAHPAVSASEAIRSSGSIEIRVTGYDNTRTLAGLNFTFYDTSRNAIASLYSDAAADFAKFFATSDLGGAFLLRAVFPLTGDAAQISFCDVTLTNAAGATLYRVPLP